MIACHCSRIVVLFAVALACCPTTHAADQILVAVGLGAPDLEHVAAQELITQFKQLFDANVVLTDHIPDKHQNLVIVGGPKKNKAARTVAGDNWPKLSEQGFILRSFDTGDLRGVIVAGDTPAATYWAVCELGHRLGIRYLLRDDIYPDKQSLKLSGYDVLMEPKLKVRAWKTLGDGVIGPESWSAKEQKKLFRQLAKKKFNHVVLSVRPQHPFVDYKFGDVHKQTATLWHGEQYPIPRDTPGRTALGDGSSFVNTDFSGKRSYNEMTEAGTRHLRRVISSAKRMGMTVGLEIAPLEFPREFERAIPGLVAVTGANALAVHPGPTLEPDDKRLKELVATQLRAYVETYPGIDTLHFMSKESDRWNEAATTVWQQLHKQLGADAPKLLTEPKTSIEGNLGVLSQSSIGRPNKAFQELGDSGYSIRYAMLTELDATVHYLSLAAWDKNVTTRSAHDDLFAPITGSQAIADRMWLGIGHIALATELTAQKDANFAKPAPNMLMKHYRAEPAPTWWKELNEHYTQAMIELYRSHGPTAPRGKPLLYYYAKRSEYVLEYLGAVNAVRAAAIAKQEGDTDLAIEQLEAAIESLYNALDTLGDVAQDPSDRGLIAALNAYAYRPLLAEYEQLLESE
jgi:hypothetical protein